MHYLFKVLLGIYLAFLALEDIRKKTLHIIVLAAGTVFIPAIVLSEETDGLIISDNAIGLIPGAVFLLLSYVSRGQVGIGDGILILILGAALGIGEIVILLTAALLLIALFSGIMLVCGKLKRKSTLPFIPFVFAGYVIAVLQI